MPGATVYDLDQADRALPLIGAIARDAREAYLQLRTRLQAMNRACVLDRVEDETDLPEEVRDVLAQIRSLTEELAQLSVTLEDPELGRVALRGVVDSREVTLCWKLGEERVGYFHPVDASYADRRPLRRAPA